MAATRSQSIAELDRKLDETRAEAEACITQLQLSPEQRIDSRMEELHNLISSQARGTSADSHHTSRLPPIITPPPIGTVIIEGSQSRNYSTRISKVDFPRFDGSKVRDWLYKCDQFFLLVETPPETRVRLASIHLDGLALQWHLNYMRSRYDEYPLWSQYAADVCQRFSELYEDPLGALIQEMVQNCV